MTSIDVNEAKAHLVTLLDEVANGASITITKHGVPVARLIPPGDERPDPDAAVDALEEFQRRTNITLGSGSLRALIDEGRRY